MLVSVSMWYQICKTLEVKKGFAFNKSSNDFLYVLRFYLDNYLPSCPC